jgi:hypothetical protein
VLKLVICYCLPLAVMESFQTINEVMNYGFNEMHLHSVEAIIE